MNARMLQLINNLERFYPHELEKKFPRIFSKLMDMWEMPEIDDYFADLMVSDRPDRQGFPADVASEIFALSRVHARLHERVEEADPWGEVPELAKYQIESQGVKFSKDGFFRAAEAGNRAVVLLFVKSGLDVDVCDERRWTPLMAAAANGDKDMVLMLLNAGANIHHVDNAGYASLHWASFNGHEDVVELLLERGADVNARSIYGWTALLQAVTRGHLGVSMQLIDHGADVNAASNEGWTALHKAAANGRVRKVILLLGKGADVHAKHKDGASAIDLARKNKYQEIVDLLAARS